MHLLSTDKAQPVKVTLQASLSAQLGFSQTEDRPGLHEVWSKVEACVGSVSHCGLCGKTPTSEPDLGAVQGPVSWGDADLTQTGALRCRPSS